MTTPQYRYDCDHCNHPCPSLDSGLKIPCSDLLPEKTWMVNQRNKRRAQKAKATRQYNELKATLPERTKRLWLALMRDNPDANYQIRRSGIIGGFIFGQYLMEEKTSNPPFWVPFGYSGVDGVTE